MFSNLKCILDKRNCLCILSYVCINITLIKDCRKLWVYSRLTQFSLIIPCSKFWVLPYLQDYSNRGYILSKDPLHFILLKKWDSCSIKCSSIKTLQILPYFWNTNIPRYGFSFHFFPLMNIPGLCHHRPYHGSYRLTIDIGSYL